jgi:RNA polymerase sigma-70 factor (ECF subfamily)
VGSVSATHDGFEQWYRGFHANLVATLALAVDDVDLARDAADEAIVRASERGPRVAAMRSPAGWTYRVAFNVARRRRRRERVERILIGSRPRPDDVAPPAGELWALVADLPERQRSAVVLRHVGHLTEVEVAAVMGITRGGVSSTLRAAYRSLRHQLADEPGTRRPSPRGVAAMTEDVDR